MARKPRPDRTIRKCKHCGWTYIKSCDCRRGYKPRRRPTDTERLDCVLKRLRGWESSTGMAIGMTTRRDIDKLLREEARRG